jgi:hypothetical protein
MNLVYHLDTGDWLIHWQGDNEDGSYEWTNPNPPDPNEREMWIRANTGIIDVEEVEEK